MKNHFVKLLPRLVPTVLVALALASCGKLTELPETGRYYKVEANGNEFFVWLDQYDHGTAKGHFYAAGRLSADEPDTTCQSPAPRHDFTAHFTRRNITINTGGITGKFKSGDVAYSLYEEPPFKEGNWKLYRKPNAEVNVTNDISYGTASGYWTSLAGAEQDVFKVFTKGYVKSFKKRCLDLTLDLYRPEGAKGKRPLILFIHGGAYYIGSKSEPAYIDFCKTFASMGYVTASINYRLGFHVSKNEIERAGYVALQDAHAALRFLVAHAKEYGIDPERVYVAGSSAGGITALNLAFLRDDGRPASSRGKKAFLVNRADLGDIESSGNDLKAKFKIIAIANMWGAVNDLTMLENARTSIVSFHGEEDTTVPFAEGYPLSGAGEGVAKLLSEEMYGSACIDAKAAEVGLRHRFYPFPGEKHAFNTTGKDKQPNANHTFIKNRIAEFFFEEMVPERATIRDKGDGLYTITGRSVSNIQWKVDGGFILHSPDSRSIRILWCADKPHALTAAGTYRGNIDWLTTL